MTDRKLLGGRWHYLEVTVKLKLDVARFEEGK